MRRNILSIFLCLVMIAAVFAVAVPMSIGAEESEFPEEPPEPWNELENGWSIEGNGTYFEITDSNYLNITLTSTEEVHVFLESIPRMVSLVIDSSTSATSTILTFTGFEANKIYYRYQDGNLQEEFTNDESGSYSYTQDISINHHVYIQEEPSTLYISSDYTFTGDINEPIVVDADNIVIDGNGYTLQGSGSGYGIYMNGRSGITIKNVAVSGFTYGIYLYDSSSNTISGNTVTGNHDVGIYLYDSSSNTISGNTVSGSRYGFQLWYSNSNIISGNTVSNNYYYGIVLSRSSSNTISGNTASGNSYYGIHLYYSGSITISGNTVSGNGYYGIYLLSSNSNTMSGNTVSGSYRGIYLSYSGSNTISGNTVSGNTYYGIYLWSSSSNTIFHNNIDNTNQLYNYQSSNTWDNGAGEGNYWSDYTGLDDGSGGRVADDGIGDTDLPHPYIDQGNGYYQIDNYPFMYENAWVYGTTPPGTNVPVTFPDEGATLTFQEVVSGGVTTCTVTESGPPPPAGFRLVPSPPPTYYEITTTATFTGLITICINYDASGLTPGQEANLNLRQYDETTSDWVVITTSLDIDNNIICGETDHLSFFGVMLRLNDPPEANAGGPYDSVEGSEITFDASDSTDPDGDLLQYRWDFDNDGNWDTEYSMEPTATHTWYDDYSGTVKVEVYDGKDTDTDIDTVVVNNVAPTATLCNNGPKTESSTVTVLFINQYDPGTSDTFTYSFDWDNDGTYDIVDQASASAQYTWYDNDVYTVKGKIKDNNDGYSEYTTDVTVNNIAPTITSIEGPVYPVQVGTSVDLTGTFTDPGTLDSHTWEINWGDEITFGDVIGYTVTEFHTYTEAGVYTIKLKIADDDGDSDSMEFKYAVVYDPEGGFVTGGGWIYSPAGAYVTDPGWPEGMVSYWKFDEGDGIIAYDSIGENHGTLYNGAQWTDGQVGSALYFTNAGDYVRASSPGPLGNSPRTVIAWVKTSSTSSQAIVTWGNMGQHQGEFGFYLEDNFLSIRIHHGRMLYEASGINDGNWHHVGIVVTETARLGDVQIFLDGVQLTTILPDSTPDVYLFTGSNKPVHIGSYLGHQTWGQFIGCIDEVAIWDKALTLEEIQQCYQNGLGGKANFGFVAKYKKGATTPTGNTEFQFKAGDLNFHSNDYEWLVVAGARAQFKGTGTINGEGEYKFILTAIDGEINGGGGVDKFRIKIWYETVDELGNEIEHIVYDNGEDPENGEEEVLTELGGGQIVIHTKGK